MQWSLFLFSWTLRFAYPASLIHVISQSVMQKLVLNKKQCFAIIKKKHSTWQHIIKKTQQTNKSVLMQFPSNKENNIKLLLIHSWWDKYLSPFFHLTRVQAGLKPESDTLNWCVFLFLPPKMHKTYLFTSCHLVVTPVRLLNSKVREKTR